MLLQQLLLLLLQPTLLLLCFSSSFCHFLKFRLLHSHLFFQHFLFLLFLLQASLRQLSTPFSLYFCLQPLFLSDCSFVGFSCSFGSKGIQLGLSIRSLFLQLSELLNLFFLLLFYFLLFCDQFCLFGGFLLEVGMYFFIFFPFIILPPLDGKHNVPVFLQYLLIYFLLFLFFSL